MSFHPLGGGLLPDVPDADLLRRILPYTYLTVACPFCKEPIGSACSTPSYPVALSTHAARLKAVARLDTMDRYRAFAALRAESVARRKETEAFLAKPLSAETLATRAAISAAFDQMNARIRADEAEKRARCLDPFMHHEECACREGRPYVYPEPKPHVVRDVTDLAAVRARKAGVR